MTTNGTDMMLIKLIIAVKEIERATSPSANFVSTFEVTPPGAAAIIINQQLMVQVNLILTPLLKQRLVKLPIGNKTNKKITRFLKILVNLIESQVLT